MKNENEQESLFYKRFEELANSQNISFYRIAKEIDISGATITNWKKPTAIPKADMAVKVAKFLNTTVEYLITGESADGLLPEDVKLLQIVHKLPVGSRSIIQDFAEYVYKKGLVSVPPLE